MKPDYYENPTHDPLMTCVSMSVDVNSRLREVMHSIARASKQPECALDQLRIAIAFMYAEIGRLERKEDSTKHKVLLDAKGRQSAQETLQSMVNKASGIAQGCTGRVSFDHLMELIESVDRLNAETVKMRADIDRLRKVVDEPFW